MGRAQVAALVLDVGRIPKGKDFAKTIALDEWVVSERTVKTFSENRVTGVEFLPVADCRKRARSSRWHQMKITGRAGVLNHRTRFGLDPFSTEAEEYWRCPLGHSVEAHLFSEVYLNKESHDGSNIALAETRLGRKTNLVMPGPIVTISRRVFQILRAEHLKGLTVEVAHLV